MSAFLGYYILNDRKPVIENDVVKWAKWFETANRRVAETHVGKARVSTVFLSLDHQFGSGPPLLFETMVFGGPMDDECERCPTWDEAEAQHAAMVERVKRSMTPV